MKVSYHSTENPPRNLNQISSYCCTDGFATLNSACLQSLETKAPDSNKRWFGIIISHIVVHFMDCLSFLSCILCPDHFHLNVLPNTGAYSPKIYSCG